MLSLLSFGILGVVFVPGPKVAVCGMDISVMGM